MFVFMQRTVRTVKGNLMLYPFGIRLSNAHIVLWIFRYSRYFLYRVQPVLTSDFFLLHAPP